MLESKWTTQEDAAVQQLTLLTNIGKSKAEALDVLLVMGVDRSIVERASQIYDEILKQIFTPSSGSVIQNPLREPWYFGSQPNDKSWPALRDHLRVDPKWEPVVESLNETSRDVLARCGNPNDSEFSIRGLVLGHVQSGKTANFTATIAKASDAGYRLFIILSGVHNSLRRQTQIRLDEQIVGTDPTNWVSLTNSKADFGNPVQALPLVAGSKLKLLAVVKKNVTRLTNLVEWLEFAQKHGALNDCPIMVIDDEADQASVNTAKDAELNSSAIHAKIKQLLDFPKVTYIGYSATPFANVLANPVDTEGIYPRDFIYALPKPNGYFGAEELFGKNVVEDDETDTNVGHNLIRYIPEEEAKSYVVSSKIPYSPLVTPSLGAAIRWFIMATAARRIRSEKIDNSSMLIHTTSRVKPQLDFVPVIKKYIKFLSTEWSSGKVDAWRDQWNQEIVEESAALHALKTLSFNEISVGVGQVLSALNVVADNSYSSDRLYYDDEPATVIAIGGNTLSRGLTLEGLISSFFVRGTSLYDSALQMGRWFGYRNGYSDLPRVWTTPSMAADFRFLSELETSVREDIERYSEDNITPETFAVRLMLHPKMQVTSRLKMQFAIPAEASFSGARPQTTYFNHLDSEIQHNNYSAADALLSSIGDGDVDKISVPGSILVRNVGSPHILKFIDEFIFHENSEMGNDVLAKYIRKQNEYNSLNYWNVAVLAKSTSADVDMVALGPWKFSPYSRSRVIPSSGEYPEDTAYLKAISSTQDFTIDLDIHPQTAKSILSERNKANIPLLIIYPIDRVSEPKTADKKVMRNEKRVNLNAVGDLIGLALSLPNAEVNSEPKDTIHVDLSGILLPETEEEEIAYIDTEESMDSVILDG